MSFDRQARIAAVFDQVVDEPAATRPASIERLCDGDQALADEVRALLDADAEPHPFLAEGVERLAAELLDAVDDPTLPRRFGRYVLVKYLDEGGMGAVYLAERDDIGDLVAIKFLPRFGASVDRWRDFDAEQRILASLNHPAIARLYDAGVSDDTPWLAMEYVDGEYLTDHVRRRGLGLRQRLALFRDVCDALRYAHRALVLHLDLKPANILVNDDGRVKLVDFGVSRRLSAPGASIDAVDAPGWLSRRFAAPEQLRGEALDIQADVYALGGVLRELLGADELMVSRADRRDLDAMCVKALQQEKARRYESVDDLMKDVDRFLLGRPLDAREGRLPAYRARKFVGRHLALVSAAAVSLLVIAALSLFFTWRLVAARDQALASEARTQRIHRVMLGLFEGDDAAAGPAEGLRVATILDRGVAEANALSGEPDLQSDLRLTLGGLFHKLGYLARAEPLLVSASNARVRHYGADDPRSVRAQLALALLRIDQSLPEQARDLATQSLVVARRRQPIDPVEEAWAVAVLGKVAASDGDYATAVTLLERAVQELARHPGGLELSEALGDLANAEYYLGHLDRSETVNLRALALDRELFGERHPHVGVDLYNLGNIELDRGQYPEAERLFRRALLISESWYGSTHQKTASGTLMVGRSIAYQGRPEDAADFYERALAMTRKTYPETHPRVGAVLSLWGDLALQQGRLGQADERFRQAAAIFEIKLGERHEFYLHQLSNLAAVSLATHAPKDAEVLLRRALAGLVAAVPESRYTAIARVRLGAALAAQRQYPEAQTHLVAGYHALRVMSGPKAVEVVHARNALRALYVSMGDAGKARELGAEP